MGIALNNDKMMGMGGRGATRDRVIGFLMTFLSLSTPIPGLPCVFMIWTWTWTWI